MAEVNQDEVLLYKKQSHERPSQGALFQNISVGSAWVAPDCPEPQGEIWDFNYVIIMTQDCDLEQDYGNRQELLSGSKQHGGLIPSILFCPAYPSQSLREGLHLKGLKYETQRVASDLWKHLKQNKSPRYHFLAEYHKKDKGAVINVAELVVDFKYFFTAPTEYFTNAYCNDEHYLGSLTCPYREHLLYRFASYLGRIGLPFDHHRFEWTATS